jgi:NADH:ubiquinone oxidoreductase subunit F (NADH-binding)
MSIPTMNRPIGAPAPAMVPRLLSGLVPNGPACGLEDHLARWGPAPMRSAPADLTDKVAASGLRGHGGAWFPVANKWRSVRHGIVRKPVLVGNGAEGEPASAKDALLLSRVPHLVLDGLSLAGASVNATRLVMYVPADLVRGIAEAVEARRRYGIDPVAIEVVTSPDRFLAGQESAIVSQLNGQGAQPSFIAIDSVRDRGVTRRPTLVQNVETLVNVALIARYGPSWFRTIGTEASPGTMLVTVTGRWPDTRILEAPLGTQVRAVVDINHSEASSFRGALLGGYGGGWVSMPTLMGLSLTEEAARQVGSSLGAGVIALLPRTVCPLAEIARVVRYLQQQGAGQCGPCIHGLADLAAMIEQLTYQQSSSIGVQDVLDVCALVEGRGACRHPDGVARLVRTALAVFHDDVADHQRHGPCSLVGTRALLPCPTSPGAIIGDLPW